MKVDLRDRDLAGASESQVASLVACVKVQSIAESLTPSASDAIGVLLGAVVLIARQHGNTDDILAIAQQTLQHGRDLVRDREDAARRAAS